MARPKKNESQTKLHVIPVRLSETQHSIVIRNAEKAGLSMAEYIRQQAVHGSINTEYRIVADFPEIRKLTRELSAIGNNMNQIARYFNTGGLQSKSILEDINEAVSGIMEIRNAALRMAGEYNGNIETHRK